MLTVTNIRFAYYYIEIQASEVGVTDDCRGFFYDIKDRGVILVGSGASHQSLVIFPASLHIHVWSILFYDTKATPALNCHPLSGMLGGKDSAKCGVWQVTFIVVCFFYVFMRRYSRLGT